jgi:sec-independent protein translocase protein TatA
MGGRLGPLEIILLVGIALLIFGPSKLGGLGKSLGEGLRNFKSAMKEEEKKEDDKKS